MLPQWIPDPEGLPFECTGCGKCCTGAPGYIWVNDEEITQIATLLKLSREEFLKKYTISVDDKVSLRDLPEQDHDCIFLKGKKCTIYDVRPTQCRTFPFWPGPLSSREAWLATAQECEGIRQDAPAVSPAHIKQALTETLEKSSLDFE